MSSIKASIRAQHIASPRVYKDEFVEIVNEVKAAFHIDRNDKDFDRIAAAHVLQARLMAKYEQDRMVTMLQVFQTLAPQLGINRGGIGGNIPPLPTTTTQQNNSCASGAGGNLPDIQDDPKLASSYQNEMPMDWMYDEV